MAVLLSSCPSAGRIATPVPPARYVPSPGSTCAGCGCPLESSMRPSPQLGPGMAVRRASSAINSGLASKGRFHRACARLDCGARGIGACRKQVHQNTPLQLTALPTDTVEVTDPTHPLYGLTFPLIGVTTKQRLGRACVVWLYPGVERVIPVAATSLAAPLPGPLASCRLSVAGLAALLAVVSQADSRQEEAHGDPGDTRNTHATPTVVPLSGPGDESGWSAAAPSPTPPAARLDESLPDDPCAGPCDATTDSSGDTL